MKPKTIKERLQLIISYIYWRRGYPKPYAVFSQRDIELLWLYFFGMSNNLESVTRSLRKLVEEGYIESFQNRYNSKPKMLYKVYESVVIPEDTVYEILSQFNVIGGETIYELIEIFRNPNLFRPLALLYKFSKNPDSLSDTEKAILEEEGLVIDNEITPQGQYLLRALKTLLKYYLSKVRK